MPIVILCLSERRSKESVHIVSSYLTYVHVRTTSTCVRTHVRTYVRVLHVRPSVRPSVQMHAKLTQAHLAPPFRLFRGIQAKNGKETLQKERDIILANKT